MVYQKMGEASWVPISLDSFNAEDVIGLEELTDYTELKRDPSLVSHASKTIKKSHLKKKKIRNILNSIKDIVADKEKCFILSPVRLKQMKKYGVKELSDRNKSNSIIESPEESSFDLSNWSIYNLHSSILKAIVTLKYEYPTEIQALVLPHAVKTKNDILGAAETGSGKTLAFGIPMINGILNEENNEEKRLQGIVLTPTRELAVQVKNHLINLCIHTDIKVAVIIGGMAPQKQNRILNGHPEIIVATPGRLYELFREAHPHLQHIDLIKYLVIDEADRMLEQGHFQDLRSLLDVINSNPTSCKKRQTMVFSATLSFEHDMPDRVKSGIRKKGSSDEKDKLKQFIEMVGMKPRPKILDITGKGAKVPNQLKEAKINCSLTEKDYYLFYLLKMYPGRTLVFCNSIDCVRRLTSLFTLLQMNPYPIHASMHQKQRLKNLERFTSTPGALLIATDVTARGLDIKDVQHVIHYQVPRVTENYIHRSGRTARAGETGIAIMLIEPAEVKSYVSICSGLNRDNDVEDFPIQHQALQTAKQIVNLAREVEVLTYRNRKENVEINWKKKAAAEMEIELDSESSEDEACRYKKMDSNTLLASKKKSLLNLLNRPFSTPNYAGCYPTKTGTLQLPTLGIHDACADLNSNKMAGKIKTAIVKKRGIKRKKK